MASTFTGKTVVVSGAAGGVGRSVVEKQLLEGALNWCLVNVTSRVEQ
jgi:NAD(P)-dependent dehydrogenase (short-subunit alcohol dehydrogenase family)